jgi:hypothetical protein
MIAYKFLRSGAAGLVSGFHWPTPDAGSPGAWVHAASPVRECGTGIHVCRAPDLPYWMCDELWAIEIEGAVVEGTDMLIAPSGRLLYRFSGWTRAGQQRFVEACRDRAARVIGQAPPDRRQHADAFMGHMDNYQQLEWTPLGALCTALAIASTYGGPDDAAVVKAAFRQERVWQSRWLIENLGLTLDSERTPAGDPHDRDKLPSST